MGKIETSKLSTETALDRIYNAYVSHTTKELSAEDTAILLRITEIDKQIENRKPVIKNIKGKEVSYNRPWQKKELVEWIVERFGVSHRTAYDDIDRCNIFFFSLETKENKEYARGHRIKIGDELMYEAAAMGDYKSAAAFFKEVNEIRGLKRTDPEIINPEHTIPSDPVIVGDASEIGFEKIDNLDKLADDLLKTFKGQVHKKINESAIDIDYEPEAETE